MNNVLRIIIFFSLIFLINTAYAQPEQYWISTREDVFVKRSLEQIYTPSISLLRYGDVVTVTEITDQWATLSPFGVIRINFLSRMALHNSEAIFLSAGPRNFLWGRVISRNAISIRNENNALLETLRRGDEVIFDSSRSTNEQLARPNGYFINRNQIEILTPSTFSGWINPPQNGFFFILRDTEAINSLSNYPTNARRYQRFALTSSTSSTVTTRNLTFQRNDVRVGYKHERPRTVPDGIRRWVHVDLEQQILTAYDNNNLIFATLVSTGSIRHPTRRGTFQVRRKITYTQMRGGSGRGSYSVEGVPWVMYFDDAISLHGSFWHDQYGTRRSHGCVNLSIADAKWLFDFAPMHIPHGWRSIHPLETGDETNNLWVVVE